MRGQPNRGGERTRSDGGIERTFLQAGAFFNERQAQQPGRAGVVAWLAVLCGRCNKGGRKVWDWRG